MSRQIRGIGNNSVIPAQSIYEESSSKKHRLGDRLQVGDRVFYYGHATEALTAGNLATVLPDTDSEDTVTVAHGVNEENVTITAASAITANQYTDGYLVVDEGTGAGEAYKIKGHPAIGNGKTGEIELYDGIATAWSTGDTDITLNMSPFNAQEGNADQKETPIGVPLIDATDEYYLWLQTWGPAPILMDESFGNATAQRTMTIGSSTDGAVEAKDAVGEAFVGQVLTDSADTTDGAYELVLLQIMP